MNCHEPIEALYYSAKYEAICVYCAKPQRFTDEKLYPQCSDCKDKPAVFIKSSLTYNAHNLTVL